MQSIVTSSLIRAVSPLTTSQLLLGPLKGRAVPLVVHRHGMEGLQIACCIRVSRVRVGPDNVAVVAFNPAVREKLHLSGKLQTLIVLLVDQITFADGTKYDFQPASKSLIDYFSDRAK